MDFTEAYQADLLRHTHVALDDLRKQFLTGELVWHFADFMTAQGKVDPVFGVIDIVIQTQNALPAIARACSHAVDSRKWPRI